MTMMLPLFDEQPATKLLVKFSKAEIEAKWLEFWGIFPKRTGNNPKWKAEQKFIKWVESGENVETIIAGARRFAAECSSNGTAGRFVPMAITWLNQKCWLNDPDRPDDQPKSFLEIARDLRERASENPDFGGYER